MPQKIVVRAPNWIGDQVLAYPCFHYLRQGYPQAHITSVCPPWVATIQFRHLVDEVCILPQPQGSSAWARLQALEAGARLLRTQGPWDLGLCLPNSFASAWLLARAGVQWRRGYATEGRGLLLHEKHAVYLVQFGPHGKQSAIIKRRRHVVGHRVENATNETIRLGAGGSSLVVNRSRS